MMREPRHVLSDHSLAVTDLCVGRGGINSRILSASMDHTCKVGEGFHCILDCESVVYKYD